MQKELQAEYDALAKEIEGKNTEESLMNRAAQFLKTGNVTEFLTENNMSAMSIKMNSYLEKLMKNNPDANYIATFKKRTLEIETAYENSMAEINRTYENLQKEVSKYMAKNCDVREHGTKVNIADCCTDAAESPSRLSG